MGHNNPKQKIQYHLRLKQELEEMRHECMLLLRERFHLEQCVRSATSIISPCSAVYVHLDNKLLINLANRCILLHLH